MKTKQSSSAGGLVGYDDWFTPSRSGVRFPPGVYFWPFAIINSCIDRTLQIQNASGGLFPIFLIVVLCSQERVVPIKYV